MVEFEKAGHFNKIVRENRFSGDPAPINYSDVKISGSQNHFYSQIMIFREA